MPSDLEPRGTITIPPMGLWCWLCTSRAHPTVIPLLWRRPLEWKCPCWAWVCRHPLLFENPNNWPRFGILEAIRQWRAERKRGPTVTVSCFPARTPGETDARRS